MSFIGGFCVMKGCSGLALDGRRCLIAFIYHP
jgi:hypothetical protein